MVPFGKGGHATEGGCGNDPADEVRAISAQRALVRLAPDAPASAVSFRPGDGRPMAPFLAHLIATVQDAPQTRERRRADPNWAITAYAAMMQVPISAGRGVRESR